MNLISKECAFCMHCRRSTEKFCSFFQVQHQYFTFNQKRQQITSKRIKSNTIFLNLMSFYFVLVQTSTFVIFFPLDVWIYLCHNFTNVFFFVFYSFVKIIILDGECANSTYSKSRISHVHLVALIIVPYTKFKNIFFNSWGNYRLSECFVQKMQIKNRFT